jgi:hypothetical protein
MTYDTDPTRHLGNGEAEAEAAKWLFHGSSPDAVTDPRQIRAELFLHPVGALVATSAEVQAGYVPEADTTSPC